jgi:hypothetical protein
VTLPPERRRLGRRPAAPRGDGPGAFALPRFPSTVGHSDFSHGIPGDFAEGLYAQVPSPVGPGPYEISRGNACCFPAVPPANTLLRPGSPSTSFAPVVQARYRLDLADRFAVSSATARQFASNPSDPTSRRAPCPAHSDRSGHSTHRQLALDRQRALIPAVSRPGAHLPLPWSLTCIPFSISDLPAPGEALPPPFGYGPRLGSVRLDFHQLATRPARRALRPAPTAARPLRHFPGSPVIGGHRFPAPRRRRGRDRSPEFPGRPSARSTPATPEGSSAPAPGPRAPAVAFAVDEPARLPLSRPTGRVCLTTLARASLALQTARSHRPRFAPGLSTTHGGLATGDPGVSPDRTRTGGPPRTCRSLCHVELLSSMAPSSLGALVHSRRLGLTLETAPLR